MSRRDRLALSLCLALTLLCVLAARARASTDEALRTGRTCASCHVSPAGGGLRTPTGADHAARVRPSFAVEALSPASPRAAHVRPRFSLGGDATIAAVAPHDAPGAARATGGAVLHLAVRPWDPPGDREGRVTLHAGLGYSDRYDAFRTEHYGLLVDDLLLDLALAAGRQRRPTESAGDGGIGATGLAIHVRPGPVRIELAVFRPAPDPHAPWSASGGLFGGALLEWQPATTAVIFGLAFEAGRPDRGYELRTAAHAGLDFDRGFGVPLRVLSRFGHTRRPAGVLGPDVPAHGLDAAHTLTVSAVRGLDAAFGYAWSDADLDVRYDSAHRVFAGLSWWPVPLVAGRLRWEHPWRYGEDRFAFPAARLVAEMHFGF
jgi:hypothetical protein